MERDLFTILNFELAATPPSTFLDHICFACHVDENAFYLSYVRFAQCSFPNEHRSTWQNYFCWIIAFGNFYRPKSLVRQYAWQIMRSDLRLGYNFTFVFCLTCFKPLAHETFANYKLGQLSECMARLLCCWKSACSPEQTLRALTEKYSSDMVPLSVDKLNDNRKTVSHLSLNHLKIFHGSTMAPWRKLRDLG